MKSDNDLLWRPSAPQARTAVAFTGAMVLLVCVGARLATDFDPVALLLAVALGGSFTVAVLRNGIGR